MTIRQVADVLDVIAETPQREFQTVATEMGYLHPKEADYLLQIQQTTAETIRSLAVECGLLTERQAAVLFLHFQKTQLKKQATSPTTAATPTVTESKTETEITVGSETGQTTASPSRPKRPNFRRRPVIIEKEGSSV
jgi:hypothetical protein